MRWQIYGILVILAVFIIALIFNPTLSCFGKKLKSPFYPILRKRRRKLKTDDYGFSLGDKRAKVKTKERMQNLGMKDYGFSRVGDAQHTPQEKKRKLKTDDNGFSLDEDDIKQASDGEKE